MGHNKGWHLHSSNGGSTHKGRPYVFIFVIMCGAALLGVMVLHKLRERRIYNLLIKEKDHQLLALQLLLQKERDRTKELRGKNEEMKAKILAVRSQKAELARTVARMQSTMDSLKEEQKVMESALEEKQNDLRVKQAKGGNLGQGYPEIMALRDNLKQKEAEIKDLKRRLDIPVNTFPEFVTANGTMKAQDKIENGDKEKDGNSHESARYGGDDKHIRTEDASRSTLTRFKGGVVTAELKGEIRTNADIGKKTEDSQDDGSAGDTAKVADGEVVKGREKKGIREEQQGHLQNDKDGGGQDFNVKRKHDHVSRTKGKRWRTIVNGSLMENNGNFASHGQVNKADRNAYRDEKELNDGLARRDADEEIFTREEKNNPRKDNSLAKLLKPGNDENRQDGNNTTVETNNMQRVTSNGINAHPEEHGDNLVQQNWSRRHINKASNSTEQTKSNMLHEETEELEVYHVGKQEKYVSDDGSDDDEGNDNDLVQESQSEFEDVKEYREEIDESEFQPDL